MGDWMENRMKKRLTKSGKGAYSIYIPKKWLDTWVEEQKKKKEVYLLELDEHLLLSPVIKESKKSLSVDLKTTQEIRTLLLSSYVRGYQEVDIYSDRKFTNEQISEARGYIRLLDENLQVVAHDNCISYKSRNIENKIEYSELFSNLFQKTVEVLELVSELLQFYDLNPQRAVHLIRMINCVEEEDIDRISFHIFRQMANLEMAVESFIDLEFLGLVADILERIGDTCIGIAGLVCDIYGIDRNHMHYPLEILEKEVESKKISIPDNLEELKKIYIQAIKEGCNYLNACRDTVMNKDGITAYYLKRETMNTRRKVETQIFEAVSRLWEEARKENNGKDKKEKRNRVKEKEELQDTKQTMSNTLYVYQIGYRIRELINYIEGLAKRACLVYYCESMPESDTVMKSNEENTDKISDKLEANIKH
jgi:phosphate uptake regulator